MTADLRFPELDRVSSRRRFRILVVVAVVLSGLAGWLAAEYAPGFLVPALASAVLLAGWVGYQARRSG